MTSIVHWNPCALNTDQHVHTPCTISNPKGGEALKSRNGLLPRLRDVRLARDAEIGYRGATGSVQHPAPLSRSHRPLRCRGKGVAARGYTRRAGRGGAPAATRVKGSRAADAQSTVLRQAFAHSLRPRPRPHPHLLSATPPEFLVPTSASPSPSPLCSASGKSTRNCHGVVGPRGSRFNLRLTLAVADCMSQLQSENRALRKDREPVASAGAVTPMVASEIGTGREANGSYARPRPSPAVAAGGRHAWPAASSPASELNPNPPHNHDNDHNHNPGMRGPPPRGRRARARA